MDARAANKGKKRPVQTSARKVEACPRVPVCLLDALREGKSVELKRHGERWALLEPGAKKPIAARKHKAAAEELLATGYGELERELRVACPPKLESADAVVFTPQRPQGEPVRFEAREAALIVSSHNPQSFAADPQYPAEVQERVYDRDPNEQRKVIVGAQTLNPAVVINRSPTPEAGPPLVTAGDRAIVLGGNGRSMMIRRAYAEDTPAATAYRQDLVRRAAEFGLQVEQVKKLHQPILVRVVQGLTAASPVRELSAAVRRYNETMTAALDDRARAVAKARQLSENTIATLGELLAGAGEKSLRDLMRDSPEAFLRVLEADGIITAQNRADWTISGALTDRAKDELEGMFLGRVLGTSQRLSTTSPAILRKVERAVPFLVKVEGVNPSFSRLGTLQAAVDLVNEAAAHKMTLEQLLDQPNMFKKRAPNPEAEELARVLLEDGQKAIAERFRRWANVAAFDPRQAVLFGKPPTDDEVAHALFRRAVNPCACDGARRRPNPEGSKSSGELRVVIEHAGKNAAGVDLYRPALAHVNDAGKVVEVYSRGETTKTALETALDAAKRLARSQGLAIDAGGLLIDPRGGRKSNPRRLVAVLLSEARTTRQLARELVLGLGSGLPGATVRVVRRSAPHLLQVELNGKGLPRRVFGTKGAMPQLRTALARQLKRLAAGASGRRRNPVVQSPREARMGARNAAPTVAQPPPVSDTPETDELEQMLRDSDGGSLGERAQRLLALRRTAERNGGLGNYGEVAQELEQLGRPTT
ncbi:MAG: hypothetical protein WC969_15370 [Elusimicrobiota bacterium]|jgi:hypothetical protein